MPADPDAPQEDAMPVDVTLTLRRALTELESERQRIDRQISAIRAVVAGSADGRGSTSSAGSTRRRRRMNAAQRRAVSQRMKAYWAARRATKAGSKSAAKSRSRKSAKAKAAKSAA
jgi:hypothetical protein